MAHKQSFLMKTVELTFSKTNSNANKKRAQPKESVLNAFLQQCVPPKIYLACLRFFSAFPFRVKSKGIYLQKKCIPVSGCS